MFNRSLLSLLALLALAACSPDLRPDGADGGGMPLIDVPGGDRPNGDRVTNTRDGTALVTMVDATASDQWVYLDLDRGESAAAAMAGWDIAIERFEIKTNGGVTGDGGVEAVRLTGTTYDAVTQVPTTGWFSDAVDGPDGNADPDYIFDQDDAWYAYDVTDHSLSPRDLVYVLRTTEHRVIKMRLLGYYDPAGTSGFVSFRWEEIPAQ